MEGLGSRQQCLQPLLGLSEPKADCKDNKHDPTVELKGTPKYISIISILTVNKLTSHKNSNSFGLNYLCVIYFKVALWLPSFQRTRKHLQHVQQ